MISELKQSARQLSNTQWQSLYNTQYVPGAGDLFLIVDMISFNITFDVTNRTWNFQTHNLTNIEIANPLDGTHWNFHQNETWINVPVRIDSSGNFQIEAYPPQKAFVDINDYNSSLPNVVWPKPITINASSTVTWKQALTLSPDNWNNDSLHISYAYSKPVKNGAMVQIALPFMVIVVICNAVKVLVIYFTIRETFTSSLLTQGDAIESFLRTPDISTVGKCMMDKDAATLALKDRGLERNELWQPQKLRYMSQARKRWVSIAYMYVSVTSST